MYPINVQLQSPQIGYAVANDAEEHKALSAAGYLPAFEGADRDALIAQLEAKGVKVDKRWSDKRLSEELAK
jgi:hypothetical protein